MRRVFADLIMRPLKKLTAEGAEDAESKNFQRKTPRSLRSPRLKRLFTGDSIIKICVYPRPIILSRRAIHADEVVDGAVGGLLVGFAAHKTRLFVGADGALVELGHAQFEGVGAVALAGEF